MNDVKLSELLNLLGDLSLEADAFEIVRAALALQTELLKVYGENLL